AHASLLHARRSPRGPLRRADEGVHRLSFPAESLVEGLHRLSFPAHSLVEGLRRLSFPAHSLVEGLRRLSFPAHSLVEGLHRLSFPAHRVGKGVRRLAIARCVISARSHALPGFDTGRSLFSRKSLRRTAASLEGRSRRDG